jgi:hypothetical protein
MRKLIVVNIVSLDGRYEGPGKDVMAMPFDAGVQASVRDRGAARTRCAWWGIVWLQRRSGGSALAGPLAQRWALNRARSCSAALYSVVRLVSAASETCWRRAEAIHRFPDRQAVHVRFAGRSQQPKRSPCSRKPADPACAGRGCDRPPFGFGPPPVTRAAC